MYIHSINKTRVPTHSHDPKPYCRRSRRKIQVRLSGRDTSVHTLTSWMRTKITTSMAKNWANCSSSGSGSIETLSSAARSVLPSLSHFSNDGAGAGTLGRLQSSLSPASMRDTVAPLLLSLGRARLSEGGPPTEHVENQKFALAVGMTVLGWDGSPRLGWQSRLSLGCAASAAGPLLWGARSRRCLAGISPRHGRRCRGPREEVIRMKTSTLQTEISTHGYLHHVRESAVSCEVYISLVRLSPIYNLLDEFSKYQQSPAK